MTPAPGEPDFPSGRTSARPPPVSDDDTEIEARGGELLRAVEDRDYLLSHVRCFLWRADVRAEDGRLIWRFSYANEDAAWRYFPLRDPGLLPDGTRSFAAALRRSRLPEDRERMRALAWQHFQANESYTQDYAVLTAPQPPDGATTSGTSPAAALPTDDPDQQHIRWLRERVEVRPLAPGRWEAVGVTVDVTEHLLLEEARLAREHEVAAARVRAMGEYFSVASHELRTPVTSVKAYTQVLLRRLERGDAVDTETLIRTLRAVDSQASRLARLIDHLLDANRVELGRLSLEPVPTAVDALVRRVVEETAARAPRAPHASIRVSVTHPPPIEAVLDPLRIEQVLVNLLDNASRHGGADRPIDVTVARDPEGVRIVVRDFGPGVPPALREAIFEPYRQVRPDSYVSGLGLGLFVSRQIVQLHGGWLRAADPNDHATAAGGPDAPAGEQGVAFVVWLPPVPPDAPSA